MHVFCDVCDGNSCSIMHRPDYCSYESTQSTSFAFLYAGFP